MFMVHVRGPEYRAACQPYKERLDRRIVVSPDQYAQLMDKRESMFGKKDFEPVDSIEQFYPGTFYLTKVDEKWRRYYQIKGPDT